MKPSQILLLGLKHKVTAISKADGRQLWCTELSGGTWGSDFITLLADDSHVFAYCGGHLHGLDLHSGQLLWVNQLPGYGYGLATLAIPGFGSAPDPAAAQHLRAQSDASNATTSHTATS